MPDTLFLGVVWEPLVILTIIRTFNLHISRNRIEAEIVIPDQVPVVHGLEIPPLILGDEAFPWRT